MKFKCLFFSLVIFFSFLGFGFAQKLKQPPIVKLIYFVPKDLQPQRNIEVEIDRLVKDVQQFYADEMDRHGFSEKTFMFETDAAGQAVVHRVNGRFADAHYHRQTWDKVWDEISQRFDTSKNIYFAVIDIKSESFESATDHDVACGKGGIHGMEGGRVIIPASGNCFVGDAGFIVAAHELGHAFGLFHDFRRDTYLMSYGRFRLGLSQCAAEWLDVHRYFNTSQATRDHPTKMQVLPPVAVSPHAIRFRFKVTDVNGLHQAQLHTLATGIHEAPGEPKMLDCKQVSGESNTVEFITSQLTTRSEAEVILQVIDVDGNLAAQSFIIDIASVLPAPDVVSVPDVNLAEAFRRNLGLAAGAPITQLDLFRLNELFADAYPLTDLTGIEHAKNLRILSLHDDQIRDLSPLVGLTNLQHLFLSKGQIRDITPLAGLTDLTVLGLAGNQIRDLSPLAGLTNLTWLDLGRNQIRDLSPLAEVANLHVLHLWGNQVSDITPLAGLTSLEVLYLGDNPISDITPLAGLRNLNYLYIWGEQISDITPLRDLTNLESLIIGNNQVRDVTLLSGLTNLTWLDLSGNQIRNITPLTELTNLENLTFNFNSIGDITPLAELKQLTSLYLIGNRIQDITPLAGLTNLTKLNLSLNQIRDITPLSELVNLENLWLSDNRVRNITPLVNLENLTNLSLQGNPIADRTPLQVLLERNPSLEVDIGLESTPDTSVPEIEVEGSITGPWLWMIAPTAPNRGGAVSTNIDSLAAASSGAVTEADVAKNGANEGDTVGNLTWTLAEIHNTGTFFELSDNVTDVVHRIGWAKGDVDHHSSYALITLESTTAQEGVMMRVGSDDSIKVWLNGEVVHNNPIDRGSNDFQDFFRVSLQQGDNLLLVKVSEATDDWSMFVGIDAEVTAVYKPAGSDPQVVPTWDVNQDGQVNVLDLILVAQHTGETDPENPRTDVNNDGVVNILDLVLVAKYFGA